MNYPNKIIWKLLSSPGHLELFHPFCKNNYPLRWEDQANKKDILIYLNGLEYHRNFKNWKELDFFELEIGKKNGKQSKVRWNTQDLGGKTILKITVFPYKSNKINKFFYFWFERFYIGPMLKKYLNNVLKGIKLYLDTETPVTKKRFGSHPWFV